MKKMMLLAVAAAVTSTCAFADARLVALWPMNEEAGATVLRDVSGNGRDASMGTGVSIQEGLFGKAAAFTGVSGETGASVSLPAFSNFTVAAWIYYTAADNNFPRIIDSPSPVIHVTTSLSTRPLQMNVANGGTWLMSATGFTSNAWNHVAVTYCGGSTNNVPVFYMNGMRQGLHKVSQPSAPGVSGGNANIGNSSGNRPFGGKMDDLRIYSEALSDREIYALATDRPPRADPGVAQTVTRDGTVLAGQLINTNPFMPDFKAAHLWQQVAGPAAMIDRPDRLETAVTLPEEGIYDFTLTVSNKLESAVYTNRVTRVAEAPGNAAPVVSTAGSETSCARPFNVLLTGSVIDDGIPVASGLVRKRWRKVSGPGGVFFDNPYSVATRASFSDPGTYELSLEADDGDKTGSASVTVTVTDSAYSVAAPELFWWRFDEPASTNYTYDTLNNRQYQIKNGAFMPAGKWGNALRAPRDSSVAQSVLTADGLTNDVSQMTLSAWVNCAGYTNLITLGRICQISSFYWIWEKGSSGGRPRLGMGSTDVPDMAWHPAAYTLTTNAWHHLAVTTDRALGTNMFPKFYIDGRLLPTQQTSNTHTGDYKSIAGSVMLGGNGNNRNLDGIIDDFRFYDRILTPAEIQLLAFDPDNNHAPVVEITETQFTLKTGTPSVMPAAAWDDGLPEGNAFTVSWSVIAGDPANVDFEDAAAVDSPVTFTKSGSYTLLLTASDGIFTADEKIAVTAVPTGTLIYLQ